MKRTNLQNRSLHLDCKLIAEKLNESGKDMRVVLKPNVNIPWTTESVKHYIWKPIQNAMYQKKSTTELEKVGEIEKIHSVIMRELGEKHGIEYHDFPHDPSKDKEALGGAKVDSARYDRTDETYNGPPLL